MINPAGRAASCNAAQGTGVTQDCMTNVLGLQGKRGAVHEDVCTLENEPNALKMKVKPAGDAPVPPAAPSNGSFTANGCHRELAFPNNPPGSDRSARTWWHSHPWGPPTAAVCPCL